VDNLVSVLSAKFETSDLDKITSITQTLQALQTYNDASDAVLIATLQAQRMEIRARLIAASTPPS
jgi:hypothetical protein